ncbi:histidine kinase [Pseudoalteromonas denitrificans]|uniref:Histidine kinase n=1 Tax=Pseudoalteromonas denitrificans DSM 6059 TaxID=1123010 RepID=A0A1I1LQT4_9GAMM|nr:histidine kinase [Pseudoalteromonas denitrificans]SFC75441.1 Histidine kinase [Pseudoalteromonas denitrificans DSM 6059]
MKFTYITSVGKNYWKYQGLFILFYAISQTFSNLKMLSPIADHAYIISYTGISVFGLFFSCHFIARGIYKYAEQKNNNLFKNILWLIINSFASTAVYLLIDAGYFLFGPTPYSFNDIFELVFFKHTQGMSLSIKLLNVWISYWVAFSTWLIIYSFISSSRFYKKLKEQNDSQELKLLLNQINPEFLYATMDAIKIAIDKDTELAANIVTQASELFRYNLISSKANHANIEQELNSLNNYLNLLKEQKRSPNDIHISLNNQEDIPNLPAMSMIFMLSHILNNAKSQTHALTIQGGIIDKHYQIEMLHTSAKKYQTDISYLKNLRLRLKQMYQNKATLLVKKDRQSHKLILLLPLI